MKKQIREVLSKYRGNQGYTMEHVESELLNLFSVSVSLLEEAANLVGNPGTNISGSCDVACMEWQEKYKLWRNER